MTLVTRSYVPALEPALKLASTRSRSASPTIPTACLGLSLGNSDWKLQLDHRCQQSHLLLRHATLLPMRRPGGLHFPSRTVRTPQKITTRNIRRSLFPPPKGFISNPVLISWSSHSSDRTICSSSSLLFPSHLHPMLCSVHRVKHSTLTIMLLPLRFHPWSDIQNLNLEAAVGMHHPVAGIARFVTIQLFMLVILPSSHTKHIFVRPELPAFVLSRQTDPVTGPTG